jgi:hypothetical protein
LEIPPTSPRISPTFSEYLIESHKTGFTDGLPIFANVDPEKFVNGFVNLKNEGKNKVLSLIIGHYSDALNIQNPEDMVHYYIDDLKTLPSIIK